MQNANEEHENGHNITACLFLFMHSNEFLNNLAVTWATQDNYFFSNHFMLEKDPMGVFFT